jgi:RNA polymerase sigma-70 factor (ECF subfamily)
MKTEEVWSGFKGELLGFIKARINDTDLAEDILQDVFIKIHLNIKSLTEDSNLASWIYRITRNAIIDHYRKKKVVLYKETLEESLPEELEEVKPDFSNCLKSFVNGLADKDKEAIEKTVFGDLSQKDYAKEIDLSYTATKSRVQRAKEKLKAAFVKCCALQFDKYGNVISSNGEACDC